MPWKLRLHFSCIDRALDRCLGASRWAFGDNCVEMPFILCLLFFSLAFFQSSEAPRYELLLNRLQRLVFVSLATSLLLRSTVLRSIGSTVHEGINASPWS